MFFFQIRKIVKVTMETFSAVTVKVEGRREGGRGFREMSR